MSRPIALIGGSFNPPHADHGRILKWLVKDCPFDLKEVWLLPVVEHALGKELAPYEQREKMVQHLINAVVPTGVFSSRRDKVKVVRREERYTVDMLAALRAENPNDEFMLIVGGDIINESNKWERWGEVNQLARVVIVAREGVEVLGDYETYSVESRGYSSTAIRQQLANGDLTHLYGKGGKLEDSTVRLIMNEGIYGYAVPEFPKDECYLDTIDILLEDILKFGPGVGWSLMGNVRKMLRVSTTTKDDKPAVRFHVVRDTSMAEENHREYLRWVQNQTEAWAKGKESTDEASQVHGPRVLYMEVGKRLPSGFTAPLHYLGNAGELEFFVKGGGGGILGGLFGGLLGVGDLALSRDWKVFIHWSSP